jgi:hypothetical protein
MGRTCQELTAAWPTTFVKVAVSLLFVLGSNPLPAFATHGDANGDGRVDIEDARLVANFLVGNISTLPNPQDADVNRDGRISTADIAAAGTAAGAFALAPGSKDAALVLTLSPGAYTTWVSGSSNTTGAALIEVYELPVQ